MQYNVNSKCDKIPLNSHNNNNLEKISKSISIKEKNLI